MGLATVDSVFSKPIFPEPYANPMTDRLIITLAQLNPVVGAVSGNIDKVRDARRQAAEAGADLIVCSELVVSGYPPEDLVMKPFFLDKVAAAVNEFARGAGQDLVDLLVMGACHLSPVRVVRNAGEHFGKN